MRSLTALLQYDRAGIADGQYWRLLSGHIVHLTFAHAAVNASAGALLYLLFHREYSTPQWIFIVLCAVLMIDVGLWVFDPQIAWYVGASGVLHGVMAAGTLQWLVQRQRAAWLATVLLVGKLAVEQLNHGPTFASEFPVVIDAHLYGAIGGLVAAILIKGHGQRD